MKLTLLAITSVILTSCATTVTTTTLPDGTVVKVESSGADAVAVGAAVSAAQILTPIIVDLNGK